MSPIPRPALLLALVAASCTGEPAPEQERAADPAPAASEAPLPLDSIFAGTPGTFVLLDLETGHTRRYAPERAAERFSPKSTFKIPNTLIGLETGVLRDADF